MIEVTEAIGTAQNYLQSVFGAEGCQNIRLEEVVLSDDDKLWTITFGFGRPYLGGTLWKKDCKMVEVDAHSGQARGVQIRELV